MQHDEILRFRIEGMFCGACSARSQRALNKMDIVDSASVSLADGTAQIRPAEGVLDADGMGQDEFIQKISERVGKLGFTASYLPPDTDEHDLWKEEQARIAKVRNNMHVCDSYTSDQIRKNRRARR
jgi:cation transport ATPase